MKHKRLIIKPISLTYSMSSQKLLELVRDMIKKTPWASRIVKCNQEELILEGGVFDRRKIFSYPSCAKTLRGVGGQVLYLEEAAYLDLQVCMYSTWIFQLSPILNIIHTFHFSYRYFTRSLCRCLKWVSWLYTVDCIGSQYLTFS